MIFVNGPLHRLEKQFLVITRTASSRSGLWFFDLNTRAFGEHSESFWKRNTLFFHNKAKNVAADVANPAFPALLIGIDLHARFAVIVKRADPYETSTLTSQFHIASNQIDDVNRQSDSIFDFVVNREGHIYS